MAESTDRLVNVPATFQTIGIIGKRGDSAVDRAIRVLFECLDSHGCDIVIDTQTAELLGDWQDTTTDRTELGATCDLVVVVGGDGTLLEAGRAVAAYGTPMLGVNLGRLGFLVDVLPDELRATMDQVMTGNFTRDQRLGLTAHLTHENSNVEGPFHGLNEVAVRNAEFARVLDFDTFTDGSFISHHRADGINVATPTGSTAYALSAGGPVLHPEMNALALVPICPHTLSDRPLIIDGHRDIEIVVGGDDNNRALFTIDGQQNRTLAPGDRVHVRRSGRDLTLIHPPGYDYFRILRDKLHWGRGQPDSTTPNDNPENN